MAISPATFPQRHPNSRLPDMPYLSAGLAPPQTQPLELRYSELMRHIALLLSTALLVACAAEAEPREAADRPAATLSPSDPAAQGWTPERYDAWVKARAGEGEPVYWYSQGTLRAFPGGELLYKLEGYDISNARRVSPTMTEQYSRKIYIYRDPVTNEVVRRVGDTDVEPIAYPYQFITYELKDGDTPYLETFVEQGEEPRVRRIGPGNEITVREIGENYLYTAPLFLDFPIPGTDTRYQTFENYDFVIPKDADQPGFITFMRYGPLPEWASSDGITQGAMHMATWRLTDYADVPATLREFVEADAPLWQAPPTDLADIRRLQGRGD